MHFSVHFILQHICHSGPLSKWNILAKMSFSLPCPNCSTVILNLQGSVGFISSGFVKRHEAEVITSPLQKYATVRTNERYG